MSNAKISREYIEGLWNRRDFSLIDKYIAPNHVNHGPTEDQFPQGPQGQHIFVSTFVTAFPDVHATITNLAEDGDLVEANITYTGTHQAELMGVPATGRQVTVEVYIRDRFENGKIVESWAEWDPNDMMRQLGAS